MDKNNLTLKKNPTLHDFQDYIATMVKKRGFDKKTIPEIMLLMIEEFGEFAKAIRKNQKMRVDKNSKEHNVKHEATDIFIYLLDICNHLNIDLEKAFREKEEINKKRLWE